jgi:hypothetical protein
MSPSRHAAVAAFALLAIVATPSGCKLIKKPTAGEPCTKPGVYYCINPTEAVYCNAGTFVALPCGGPKGCTGVSAAGVCDDDLANVGDACVTSVAGSNYSCAKDLKSEVMCQADKFVLDRPCKGPSACQVKSNAIYCDDSVADVGDPCTMGRYSCSSDHVTELGCMGAKFAARMSCRGPSQCGYNATTKNVFCDKTVALVGDPCDTEGFKTCAADGKTLLSCSASKYVSAQACKTDCVPSQTGTAKCQ